MEFMDFLGGCDAAAWQILSVMDAADRAFVRLDDAGRIITQTDRAEDLLQQPPLRSIYEVLGELAARTIRIAIERRESMRTRDMIDGCMVTLTICPGEKEHLLYLAPEPSDFPLLRDQLAEQRLRMALSVLVLDDAETRHRALCKMFRLMRQLEILQGKSGLPRTMKQQELGAICVWAAQFVRPCTCIPITTEGSYTSVVCESDETKIALYHLLTNAIQTPGVSRIVIRWGSASGCVWFEVADDGTVLSEDAFSALCTAYSRVGTLSGVPPQIEGHTPGLGLPAVCEIAMRHGGGVSLVDAPEGKAIRVTYANDLHPDPFSLYAPKISEGLSIEDTELSVLG